MKSPAAILALMMMRLFALGQDGNPDYSDSSNWAALPWRVDAADRVPVPYLRDNQATAEADVFFIHPTTYYGRRWNASLKSRMVNNNTDRGPIRLQAVTFNGDCRVYAPRYRQAAVRAFRPGSLKGDAALELAYKDVRAAFRYYLDNYNQGRPVIIAAHSQGSRHAVKLLSEFFDGTELGRKLITAYIVGWPVKCDTFQSISACDSAGQTGCFNSWNTFLFGSKAHATKIYKDACCTNPLNWSSGGSAEKSTHLGSTPITFDRIDRYLLDARCINGIMWVNAPALPGYVSLGKNFHLMDYNLFYANLRENIHSRVTAYLRQHRAE